MNLVKTLKSKGLETARIAAIDASSRSVAISIFDRGPDTSFLIATVKFDLPKKDMSERFDTINKVIPETFEKWGPIDIVAIEQTIYIQSPQTSRILSYIVGSVWSNCVRYCDKVTDVTIASWKGHIGYKNVTRAEKKSWVDEMGETEGKKYADNQRKQRTINIVHDRIENIDHIIDNDICDSIGIGLYAIENL